MGRFQVQNRMFWVTVVKRSNKSSTVYRQKLKVFHGAFLTKKDDFLGVIGGKWKPMKGKPGEPAFIYT